MTDSDSESSPPPSRAASADTSAARPLRAMDVTTESSAERKRRLEMEATAYREYEGHLGYCGKVSASWWKRQTTQLIPLGLATYFCVVLVLGVMQLWHSIQLGGPLRRPVARPVAVDHSLATA